MTHDMNQGTVLNKHSASFPVEGMADIVQPKVN